MKSAILCMLMLAGPVSAFANDSLAAQIAQKLAVFDSISFKYRETSTETQKDDDGAVRENTDKIFASISFENGSGDYFLKRRIFSLNSRNEFEYAGDSEFSFRGGITTNLWENNGSRFILAQNGANALKETPDNYASAYRVKNTPVHAPLITAIWTNFVYGRPPLFYWNLFKDFKFELKSENGSEYFYFPDTGIAVYVGKNSLLPEKIEWLTSDDDMRPYAMKRVITDDYIRTDYGFFPQKVTIELCAPDGPYQKSEYEIDGKSLSFNGVTPESLNVILPEGCFMNDEIDKKSYRVSEFGPDLKREDIMMKILEDTLKKSETLKDTVTKRRVHK